MVRAAGFTPALVFTIVALSSCNRGGPFPSFKLDDASPAVRRTLSGALETAEAQPNNAAASGQLGKLLLAHGLPDPALTAFERARLLDPASASWSYYAGVIYQNQKNFAEAKEAFEAHLTAEPTSFAGTVRLAETLFGLGDKAGSLERFAEAIGRRPAAPRACYGMGVLLQSQGKAQDATRFFERALDAYPRYIRARLALAGQTAEPPGDDAVPFDDPLMAEVRRMDTGPRGIRLQAQQLARGGKVGRAVMLLQAALREDPRQTGFRSDLMMYFTHLKKWEKAEDLFRAMVNENPGNAVAHAQHGEILVAQDKCEEAVEAFDTALEIDHKLAMAHVGLGECQLKLARYASAESHFRQAVASQPDYSKAHARLGVLLVQNRQYAEAIPHLIEAGDAHGREQARVLFALGAAYQNTGNAAKASETLAVARVVADAYGAAISQSAPAP